jgi:hypothetical protein
LSRAKDGALPHSDDKGAQAKDSELRETVFRSEILLLSSGRPAHKGATARSICEKRVALSRREIQDPAERFRP